jgi:transcriptional regulator with XRE-family HTH domain
VSHDRIVVEHSRDVNLMAIAEDPAIPRRKLKVELRAARTRADLTREEAAADLDWSLSKMVRIETGDQGISVTDLRAMLQLYKITDGNAVRELTALARNSRGQTWWAGYRDVVSRQYGQLLGYEASASYIHSFHPLLVPGLLHDDDYAYELRRVRMPEPQARKLVSLLAERQERLFDQPKPPEVAFVFGEEALHRWIGGSTVMRRQLRHLLEISESSDVSVQVIPFNAGAHPGLIGPFALLGLQDSGEDLLFLEGAGGDVANRDDQDMIISFTEQFETLRNQALREDSSRALIAEVIEQFDPAEPEHSADTTSSRGRRPQGA